MIQPPRNRGGYVAAPVTAWFFQDHVQIISGTLVDAHYPGRRELERLGRQWGIGCAGEVVDEVVQSLREWRSGFAEVGVSEQDAQRFAEIDIRLEGVE